MAVKSKSSKKSVKKVTSKKAPVKAKAKKPAAPKPWLAAVAFNLQVSKAGTKAPNFKATEAKIKRAVAKAVAKITGFPVFDEGDDTVYVEDEFFQPNV